MNCKQEKYGYLLLIEDNKGKRIMQLTETIYSLGRSRQRKIRIDAKQVSRYHATLVRKKNPKTNYYDFFIVDGDLQGNKSTNGLLVNGIYKASHQLKHGDVVYLGYHSTYGEKTQLKYFQFLSETVEQLVKSGPETKESTISKIMGRKESYKDTMIA